LIQVLHPGLKLEYFRQKDWEDSWIDAAEELVHNTYITHYQDLDNLVMPGLEPVAESVSAFAHYNANVLILITILQVDDDDDFTTFGNISVTKHVGLRSSELQEYLRKPVENVKDPLKWWVANRHVYPKLHRMALDYLSIPATSTAVERVFSQGRQLLSFTRSRLRASSIRAFLCLGSWGRNDLLFMEDILAAVRSNKRKREESFEV
jgi:hAT family C-terminal dimerisation region